MDNNVESVDRARLLPSSLIESRSARVVVSAGAANGAFEEQRFGKGWLRDGDLFEWGSLTKVLTTTLLVRLADAGLLHLNDRLAVCLEGVVTDSCPVRLLDLATHHSGLPRLSPGISGSNPYAHYDTVQLERFLHGYRWGSVRASYRYSNLGYAVLGLALERGGGEPYAALLRRYVLEPFGMTRTYVAIVGEASHGNTAQVPGGYTASGMLRAPRWEWKAFAPCGGVVGPADDLARFMIGLSRDQALQRVFAPTAGAGAGSIGLGWMVPQGDTPVWHNGSTYGYSSYASLKLDTARWLIVLVNRGSVATALGRQLEAAFSMVAAPTKETKPQLRQLLAMDAMMLIARLFGPLLGWPLWLRVPVAGVIFWALLELVQRLLRLI